MSFQKSIRLRGALDQSDGELYQFENWTKLKSLSA